MGTEDIVVNGGFSIAALLGLAFVILKLCHIINWPWWLVTLPFWGAAALFVLIFLIWAAVVVIDKLI